MIWRTPVSVPKPLAPVVRVYCAERLNDALIEYVIPIFTKKLFWLFVLERPTPVL